MKTAFKFVCEVSGFCAVIYVLCLVRIPGMRPDLGPAIRSAGNYINGVYPEVNIKEIKSKENAERIELLVHELPQTPRN